MVSGFNLVFHLLFVYIFFKKKKGIVKGTRGRRKKVEGKGGESLGNGKENNFL